MAAKNYLAKINLIHRGKIVLAKERIVIEDDNLARQLLRRGDIAELAPEHGESPPPPPLPPPPDPAPKTEGAGPAAAGRTATDTKQK